MMSYHFLLFSFLIFKTTKQIGYIYSPYLVFKTSKQREWITIPAAPFSYIFLSHKFLNTQVCFGFYIGSDLNKCSGFYVQDSPLLDRKFN